MAEPKDPLPLEEQLDSSAEVRVRHNFSAQTKRLLAERVGYLCSNPGCRILTIGPRRGETKSVITGVAAHIAAASIGGPRYDATFSPEIRASYDNGIWLCANHAHQIDHDVGHFTVDVLRKWKSDAEDFAGKLMTGATGGARVALNDGWTSVSSDADYVAMVEMAQTAAVEHLASFKKLDEWPRYAVQLGMSLSNQAGNGQEFTVDQLAGIVRLSREIKLVAPPGTGKTTTMVQLGDAIAAGGAVPLLIPLPEWSGSPKDSLEWAADLQAFRALPAGSLRRLMASGDLVLLLDGLNELPGDARSRLIAHLDTLRREYPLMMLVISTRRQALDIPFGKATVEIQELADDQQEEIARSLNGDAGLEMLDHAWRTAGLRDLVGIPLYLSALLRLAPNGALPETKDEVIAALVKDHEKDWRRSDTIETTLGGQHALLLQEIATSATKAGQTSIGPELAMAAIANVAESVPFAGLPSPKQVLDTLVNMHALRRDEDGKVRFSHHQLQEWYASQAVEAMLLAHSFPDLLLSDALSIDVINVRAWEESLLFACERLSRRDAAGLAAVSKVVRVTIGIDPSLAAAVIRRSSARLWDLVSEIVMRFSFAWHQPDSADLALSFMVATGRPEFAATVWPLISQSDRQKQLEALRMAGRFTPSAFEEQLTAGYDNLPEETRATLLGEFVDAGGMDGIDGAVRWALGDPSSKVKIEVIESLIFRRAGRHASKILEVSGPDVWAAVATKGYYEEGVENPDHITRLRAERAAAIGRETSLARKLSLILEVRRDLLDEGEILPILESPQLDMRKEGIGWTLTRLNEIAPQILAKALVSRIGNGLTIPYGSEALLETIEPQDTGPVARAALEAASRDVGMAAAAIVGATTVRCMLDEWLILDQGIRDLGRAVTKEQRDTENLKASVIKATKPATFLTVLLQFAEETRPYTIAALSELLRDHGSDRESKVMPVDEDIRSRVVDMLVGWAGALVANSDTDRGQMNDLATAMRRFPDSRLVKPAEQLLDADIKGAAEERANDMIEARRGGVRYARMSYDWTYRDLLREIGDSAAKQALLARLGDEQFGSHAACGLAQLFAPSTDSPNTGNPVFRHWIDYRRAALAHQARQSAPNISLPEADAILAEAERHLFPESLAPARAINMAGWGFMIPHGNRDELISRLFGCTVTSRSRFDLITKLFLGGHKPDHTVLLVGLQLLFAENERNMWSLENDPWEVFRWLELFPQSTKPESLFDALDIVAKHFRDNLRGRIDGLLTSIRHMPGDGGPGLLRELARRHPDFLQDHSWYQALISFDALDALGVVVQMSDDPDSGWSPDRTAYSFPGDLGYALEQRPGGLEKLSSTFAGAALPRTKAFLAKAMLETGRTELFMQLVEDPTGREVIRRELHMALQSIAYRRDPPIRGSGSFTHIPVDASPLRAALFRLANGGDAAAAEFGKRCLTELEELRSDYGRVDTEPRHPDIKQGVAWPNPLVA